MNVVRIGLIAVGVALAATPAPASADPGGPIVTCHPSTEGGTDTDTCVGNPDVAGGSHDEFQVGVRPCFSIGFGFGVGCDD